MTDAELIQEFSRREQDWFQSLSRLASFHQNTLGQALGPIKWSGDYTVGMHGWLGFYWTARKGFWFGFGLYPEPVVWIPMIEIHRDPPGNEAIIRKLQEDLPAQWKNVLPLGTRIFRFWPDYKEMGDLEACYNWHKDRAKEIHEYFVTPTN